MNLEFLNFEELEAIFRNLPLDITFIDKNDRVRFFSHDQKIFHRTATVIGRSVQSCHRSKSVHIVNKILESFKEGRKQVAEFWINLGGRLVHIRTSRFIAETANILEHWNSSRTSPTSKNSKVKRGCWTGKINKIQPDFFL